MKKLFLSLSAVALGALAQPYPLDIANAAAPRITPARLEGMAYVAARRIILSIRRTDWRIEVRRDDGELVSVDSGRCTKAPFSGFPSAPLPEEPT